ncbi:MAG: ABC-F family ATP-binding cassette domain-containing protein [Alphaproteobacteria bacterium]
MINIDDITFRIGGRVLFDKASAFISDGQHIGLIGKNGCGKTTLFKIINNWLQIDSGNLSISSNQTIGFLPQEPPLSETSVIDYVVSCDTKRSSLLEALENMPDDDLRISDIHEKLNAIDANSAEARASSILTGLGFEFSKQQEALNKFSGGWRMRAALAAVLFVKPDVMLLDEPTNHLDFESAKWLETYLARYSGTIVLISHDRNLLNKVANRIIHIDNKKLVSYTGNYDEFEATRQMKMALANKAYEKQLEEKKHMMKFVDRFRYKATKAKQAQSRLKKIEKMPPLMPVVEDRAFNINFPEPKELPPPLITLENCSCGYGDKTILSKLNLRIDMDDRIALLGTNGNGKSTFARLISRRIKPMSGSINISPSLEIGYFSQERSEELDVTLSPFEHISKLFPDKNETFVRSYLGRFSFGIDIADNQISKLSGGEKTRLVLATICHTSPQILILDEPTNHLDIDTRNALCEAINNFKGAVILITHDASIIEMTTDNLWLVDEGTCKPFVGDINDYSDFLSNKNKTAEDSSSKANLKKQLRKEKAEKRLEIAPLKKELKQIEHNLAKLNSQKNELEKLLASPEIYEQKTSSDITKIQKDIGYIEKDINQLEETWLEISENIERNS